MDCPPRPLSFLSPSPFALALWWSAHVVPHGVPLLLSASVPVSSRCTLLKLHLALSLFVAACIFISLTFDCWMSCSGCLVHSLPLSVMTNAWAVRPKEPSGFRGRKAILNHASALVMSLMSTDI